MIEFKIGADPEFCGIRPGAGIVTASPIIGSTRTMLSEYYRDEDCTDENSAFLSRRFGSDGCGTPFEVRPKENFDPLEVVANISKILKTAAAESNLLGQFDWVAGSCPSKTPIGGHIHFGLRMSPEEVSKKVLYLDAHLGVICALIEDHKEGKARRATGYGDPGSYRQQPWGFEYRTPGSWLTSPYVAAACLCLGKAIVLESMTNHSMLDEDTLSDRPSDIKYNEYDKMYRYFPALWERITKLTLYKDYSRYIDILYYLVTKKLTWFPGVSMKEAWGITEITKRQKRVNIDSIWSDFRKELV